jgi:type I restriction enzyme M protein
MQNQMRSKLKQTNKDILGFIFYKYPSDKQIQFCKKEEFTDTDVKALSEEDIETITY